MERVDYIGLAPIPDERGMLMEILRSEGEIFSHFGQLYITTTYPGVVKAWHCHQKQTDLICCIKGMIKLVTFDDRYVPAIMDGAAPGIQEFIMGDRGYKLVKIPPGVWHGWKCISEEEAFILNIPDELYNHKEPDELRRPAHHGDIPYSWERFDR